MKKSHMKEIIRSRLNRKGIYEPPKPTRAEISRQRKIKKLIKDNSLHAIVMREVGSIPKFMEYLSYCVPDEDGKIGGLIEYWNKVVKAGKRITLNELLMVLDLEAGKVYGWASEGAYRFMHHTKNFQLAAASPGIIKRNVAEAEKVCGLKDRQLFVEMAGFLPKGTGVNVNVQQTNENLAQAAAEARADGNSIKLPSFDEDNVNSCHGLREGSPVLSENNRSEP